LRAHLAKLMRGSAISDLAQQAFLALDAKREEFAIYRDIVREGEPTERCCFVEAGLISRYKTLRNGDRQIVSFHLAGDLVDLQSSLVRIADHGIRTHTPTTIFTVASNDILRLAADYPELGRAFWFDTLVDAAIFREWTLNVGRRTARERTAHLLLEFAYRFQAIGQSDGREFILPVTQADLADAVGLSAVHVNRSLQWLRAQGLIRTFGKTVVIEDREALIREADFRSIYLHPEGPRNPT
jgi:CRP-like cAMP-binding protein